MDKKEKKKKRESIQESLQRLNDNLLMAKENGNKQAQDNIKRIIQRLERELNKKDSKQDIHLFFCYHTIFYADCKYGKGCEKMI